MLGDSRHIVGIDVGTSKVCALIGKTQQKASVEVVGIGCTPSKGLRKGVVVNLDSAVEGIRLAVEEAELMAGVEIGRVLVGVAGAHIQGLNSHGVVAVSGKRQEVVEEDIRRVFDAAKAISLPQDRQFLHVLPQEFVLDGQDGIGNPLGMSGGRLEANVHIVTGAVTSIQNIITCLNRAGIEVIDTVLEPLASSQSILTRDERELGVALIDIGGGTTDLAIFRHGSLRHTAIIPIGGGHVTNDIAVGLRTPIPEAEKIKKRCGCALASLVKKDEIIRVPSVGGQKSRLVSRAILAEIIEPRAEETLSLVDREIQRCGYRSSLNAGVVLTGGGSMLDGIPEMAETIFDLPVRVGSPSGIGGLVDIVESPIYATAVGLIRYGQRANHRWNHGGRLSLGTLRYRLREWLSEVL